MLAKPVPFIKERGSFPNEGERFAFIKSFCVTSDYAECIPTGELGLSPDLRTYPTFNQLDSAYSRIRHSAADHESGIPSCHTLP